MKAEALLDITKVGCRGDCVSSPDALTNNTVPCSSKRGLLIVFEGLDRSGKDTIIARIIEKYASLGTLGPIETVHFPKRDTPLGQQIDKYLRKELDLDDWVFHEMCAKNRREAMDDMAHLLEQGTTVICSRYAYSGAVYTAAKGYPLKKCMLADKGILQPDLVFLLNVPASKVSKRDGFGVERYETVDIQTKVAELYHRIKEIDTETEWAVVPSGSVDDMVGCVAKRIDSISGFGTRRATECGRTLFHAIF